MSSTASATPSASAIGGSGGSSSNNMPTGTLPFSFLITFVAVFLFFLSCGFCSRRLSLELRRTLGLPLPTKPSPPSPPAVWDVVPYIFEGRNTHVWSDVLPLSATCVYTAPAPPPIFSDPASVSAPPTHHRILDYVPVISVILAFTAMRRGRPLPTHLPGDDPAHPEPPRRPVRALQVSVLVAMPSPDRARHRAKRRLTSLSGVSEEVALPILGYNSGSSMQQEGEKATQLREEKRDSAMSIAKALDGLAVRPVEEAELGEYAVGIAEIPWTDTERARALELAVLDQT